MEAPEIRQASVGDSRSLTAVYGSAYQENRELGFPASAESVSLATVADWIQEHRIDVATVNGEIVGGMGLEATATDRVASWLARVQRRQPSRLSVIRTSSSVTPSGISISVSKGSKPTDS